MPRIDRTCASFALLLLLPGLAAAQTESSVRKPSLRAASNEPQPIERIARPPGPVATDGSRRSDRSPGVQSKTERRDPVGNGIAIGMLTGALGGAALTWSMYAQCDDTCDAPAVPAVLFPTMALGAGIGAVVGYFIDKAR
jgi:hypothetical protein